jgi:uncharacterized membrane protein YfcA
MISAMISLLAMSLSGLIGHEILLWSVASVPVLVMGDYAGNWGFRRSRPHHHRLTALIFLSVLGVLLIVRALGGG